MSEPRLQDLSDYDTLSGKKRTTVFVAILVGLVIGTIYVLSYHYFGNVSDSIPVEKNIATVPVE